jgi:hypothetical protein
MSERHRMAYRKEYGMNQLTITLGSNLSDGTRIKS